MVRLSVHRWFLLVLVLLLLGSSVSAQGGGEVPAPSPTDTAQEAARCLTVEAFAPLPQGVDRKAAQDMAREAALLQAWHELAEEAQKHRGLESPGVEIDPAHPLFEELGWVLSSRVISEGVEGSRFKVVLESPPVGDLDDRSPLLERSMSADLDGDGRKETVATSPDGRVYVLRGDDVVGSTQGLASLLARRGRGPEGRTFDQVRLARLVSVVTAEPAGKGRARVVARLTSSEAVEGRYAGSASERREILVSLASGGDSPSIDLEKPSRRDGRPVLRGQVVAPSGLKEVALTLNGEALWTSPPSFQGRELQLDIVLNLKPGPNEAVVKVSDRKGRTSEARLALEGPPPPARGEGSRRALVIGVNRYERRSYPRLQSAEQDATRVAEALRARGFEPVTTLLGPAATGAALREALETLAGECQSGDRVFVYFAGLSSLGKAAEGKLLLPWDSEDPESGLSADALARWARSLPSVRLAVVLDTAQEDDEPVDTRWLEGSDFLAALAAPGRVLLASGDPSPEAREAPEPGGGLLTTCLLDAWKGNADFDGDGRVSSSETYRLVVTRVLERLDGRREAPGMPLLRGDESLEL